MDATPIRKTLGLDQSRPVFLGQRRFGKTVGSTNRWGGESCWPLPLSVAQHSLLVLAIRREMEHGPLTPEQALRELLHDAEEGFLGFDCISPLKHVLGESFRNIEASLSAAVWKRYQLPMWSKDDHRIHKAADRVAAASEAVHCVGWPREEVVDVLGITAPVLTHDPLLARYGGIPMGTMEC